MRVLYTLKRLQEALGAIRLSKKLASHDQWTNGDIKAYQRRHLYVLINYALEHSPFYRDFYGDLKADINFDYTQLPVLDKKTMLENYDRLVTDPRLKLRKLERHIDNLTRDTYYLGQYRVLSTGGSSGLNGVFAFNRNEWCTMVALFQRAGKLMGMGVRLPNRLKMATIMACHPRHPTARIPESADFGLVIFLRRSASEPLEDLVAALNEFQPEILSIYPSIGALLAEEQLEGRLKIRPRAFVASSEVCTDEMQQLMVAAWGKNFFNTYASTEALTLGMSCSHNKGIHIFEDHVILENVDENNRPVPNGVLGSKVLITNLHYFTQPLIRYEITDMVKIAPEPCPCGRPFRLIETIEGRSDDVLELEGIGSTPVSIHPSTFRFILGHKHALRQYQVVHRNDGLHFNLVLRDSSSKEKLIQDVKFAIRKVLDSHAAKCPPIWIHFVDRLQREQNPIAKLKLVKKEAGR
jgi:phenylacetate-coenzyme A ligase PaaK-like adenylate-forming protein